MDDILFLIAHGITTGGMSAIIALLISFIFYQFIQIISLQRRLDKKDAEIKTMLEEASKVNADMIEAINGLKITLVEIRTILNK